MLCAGVASGHAATPTLAVVALPQFATARIRMRCAAIRRSRTAMRAVVMLGARARLWHTAVAWSAIVISVV